MQTDKLTVYFAMSLCIPLLLSWQFASFALCVIWLNSCFSYRSLLHFSFKCIGYWKKPHKNIQIPDGREPGSFKWYAVTGEAHTEIQEIQLKHKTNYILLRRQCNTEIGCWNSLWCLHPWKYLKYKWMWSWAPGSSWHCLSRGVAWDGICRSLPSPGVLWIYVISVTHTNICLKIWRIHYVAWVYLGQSMLPLRRVWLAFLRMFQLSSASSLAQPWLQKGLKTSWDKRKEEKDVVELCVAGIEDLPGLLGRAAGQGWQTPSSPVQSSSHDRKREQENKGITMCIKPVMLSTSGSHSAGSSLLPLARRTEQIWERDSSWKCCRW